MKARIKRKSNNKKTGEAVFFKCMEEEIDLSICRVKGTCQETFLLEHVLESNPIVWILLSSDSISLWSLKPWSESITRISKKKCSSLFHCIMLKISEYWNFSIQSWTASPWSKKIEPCKLFSYIAGCLNVKTWFISMYSRFNDRDVSAINRTDSGTKVFLPFTFLLLQCFCSWWKIYPHIWFLYYGVRYCCNY